MSPAPSAPQIPHPFLTANWRYLVMLNYKVDPALLIPLVPAGTILDAWHNDTYLSLVGFRFENTRVMGRLPVPGHINFDEINLRFYVRPTVGDTTRRAVVFIREIVPRRMIALIANWRYNEPYVSRKMQSVTLLENNNRNKKNSSPGTVTYSWKNGNGRWNKFGVTIKPTAPPPTLIEDDTEEEFIAEHYWGYTPQRDGNTTIEYAVSHPRWRVWSPDAISEIHCDIDFAAEYGKPIADAVRSGPASAFLADGSAVKVGKPRKLQ